MRTVQTVVFFREETPVVGTVLIIDRKTGEGDEREEVQRFTLADWEERENDRVCGLAWQLEWKTRCTSCGQRFTAKTNNYTKSLPRRCKRCKRHSPYDPSGWSKRPRNRYVRVDPGEAAPVAAIEHDEPENVPATAEQTDSVDRWPLLGRLDMATHTAYFRAKRAELGGTADGSTVRDAIEADLRAETGDVELHRTPRRTDSAKQRLLDEQRRAQEALDAQHAEWLARQTDDIDPESLF